MLNRAKQPVANQGSSDTLWLWSNFDNEWTNLGGGTMPFFTLKQRPTKINRALDIRELLQVGNFAEKNAW